MRAESSFDENERSLNRVIASLTLLLGLAALMLGIYAEQWNVLQTAVRAFLPFLG